MIIIMVVFERQGNRGVPAITPPACNQCQYSEARGDDNILWDTARDAAQFYVLAWRNPTIQTLWTAIWNAFNCPPPGKNCNIKQACGNNPTFLEGGAVPVVDPADGNIRWQLYMIVGREIQCVNDGNGCDVPIEIPEIPIPEPLPQPSPSPNPTIAKKGPMQKTNISVLNSKSECEQIL